MTKAPVKTGTVGYKQPPKEHQFAKGKSGNPKGRPPKRNQSKSTSSPSTQLEDILMAEALRPIQVRENELVIEMPMIQAVLRSMGVAAVKGSLKAQTTLANMVQAVETKRQQELLELFKTVVEYKEGWRATFEAYDRRGESRPEPVPHPDEIVVDTRSLRVKFNGPLSEDDKAEWDRLSKRRQDAFEEIAYLRKAMKRDKKHAQFYEDDINREQKLADMIGGIIPDERTRRQPGFDIQKWRDRNGEVARLRKKHSRRATT